MNNSVKLADARVPSAHESRIFLLSKMAQEISLCFQMPFDDDIGHLNVLDNKQDIDGAYFGTTFPHLFLMSYGHLKPQKPTQNYTPRVFGFKMHKP
ncbi:Casein kinase II [Theobroma cacao]|nr:Casein kinase II [Theobroma cacao]